MSEWSSYKDQQDLFESWREYVDGEAELEKSSLNEASGDSRRGWGLRSRLSPGSAQGVFDRLKTAKLARQGGQVPTPVPEPPECPYGQVPDPEDPTKCIEAQHQYHPNAPMGRSRIQKIQQNVLINQNQSDLPLVLIQSSLPIVIPR